MRASSWPHAPFMESLTFEKESTTSELFIATKEGFTPYKGDKNVWIFSTGIAGIPPYQ